MLAYSGVRALRVENRYGARLEPGNHGMSDETWKKPASQRLGRKLGRKCWDLAKGTARGGARATSWTGKRLWKNRRGIGGAAAGAAKASADAAVDTGSHIAYQRRVARKTARLAELADRQKQLAARFTDRVQAPNASRRTVLDTVAIGGETLNTYLRLGEIPEEIQRAYEGAYPNLASEVDFLDRVQELNGMALTGFVSGVKGKLFELQYVDHLNDGALPDGYVAFIAESPINPGWDIGIRGSDGQVRDLIQLKATESVGYVQQALDRYPHIDVVTTTEVQAQLVAQGMADQVIDSGITLEDVHSDVYGAINVGEIAMDWSPPIVAVALIAFTSYSRQSMSEFDRSREFGNRSTQAYLAYLAGGAVTLASGTVWLGLLGAVGSKLLFVSGRKKTERLHQLNDLIRQNKRAQKRLEYQLSDRPFWSDWAPGAR